MKSQKKVLKKQPMSSRVEFTEQSSKLFLRKKIMNFNESLGTGAGKPMIEQNISNATIDENADGSAKRSTKQYI